MSQALRSYSREISPLLGRSGLRIALLPGEVLSLPRKVGSVEVISGNAWITHDGMDIIEEEGSCESLTGIATPAVVSAVGNEPALIEFRE